MGSRTGETLVQILPPNTSATLAHGLTSLSLRFLISNMGLVATSIKKKFVVEHFLYIMLF